MSEQDIIDKLIAIQIKHSEYFADMRMTILDCVDIELDEVPIVRLKSKPLPQEIINDIIPLTFYKS